MCRMASFRLSQTRTTLSVSQLGTRLACACRTRNVATPIFSTFHFVLEKPEELGNNGPTCYAWTRNGPIDQIKRVSLVGLIGVHYQLWVNSEAHLKGFAEDIEETKSCFPIVDGVRADISNGLWMRFIIAEARRSSDRATETKSIICSRGQIS
ncbi:hypothetical protein C8F04DRAFT_342998 [Mycena alexandri]|uniref:Uncharacterized protein n=1 Tax=Mycena alexandri TaxID=1745969 RepID=A0AAD6XFN1_9AGAR|nr:hypothetical protein C8F04DRAFT_342998 [Mycena alexandri]